MYELKPWPINEEEISGYVFKGKNKKFLKSVENLKIKLNRGFSRKIADVEIKLVDSKKIKHGVEKNIEVRKDNEVGNAKLKIYDVNAKKKHVSMVVNKSK